MKVQFIVFSFLIVAVEYAHTSNVTNTLKYAENDAKYLEGPLAGDEDDNDLEFMDDDPETAPQLFEGDIAVDANSLRVGINPYTQPERLWEDGEVPFKISSLYTKHEKEAIVLALETLSLITCLKFVPLESVDAEDYIFITPPTDDGPKGCWSFVGKKGGEQLVVLQQPDEKGLQCFSSIGRVLHELLHTLGIFHEQSRSDRDDYVQINWENIVPKFRANFKRIPWKKGSYDFEYDYNSVMHYGEYYFSKRKGQRSTITPLALDVKIGQRRMMTETDCLKVNHLYNCLRGRRGPVYRKLCANLGTRGIIFG